MKRLLLSACLVVVVFAGYPPHSPKTNQATPATADPMTLERGVSIVPKNRTVQGIAFRPSETDSMEHATLNGSPLAPSVQNVFALALPQTSEAKEPTSEAKDESKDEAADESAMWVKVIRGATVHNGPSVSAPVVSYLAVGKELHLVDSQQEWFQVFDPATGQRGWVYAQCYVASHDSPRENRMESNEI